MRFCTIGVAIVALTVGLAVSAHAQQLTTGTITGVVQDETGGRVPGVTVEIRNEQTRDVRSTVSNDSGLFTVAALPAGRYALRLSLQGFATIEQLGVQLRSGEVLNAGMFRLTLGAFTETMTVTADAAVVQTANAERNAVLEERALESLVARGRDPLNLLRTLPGVAANLDTNSLGATNGAQVPNIAGLQRSTVMLDGMIANDADTNAHVSIVNLDALAEIKVVASGMAAEYGRSGGAQISLTSRSGTSEFHGSVSFYKRHDALNATPLLNKLNNLPKPFYRYNTLTGTLGGPVYIPRLLTGLRDRMFFFYTREMWSNQEPQNQRTTTMPTALERQGDFSQTLDTNGRLIFIRDPAIPGGTCNPTTGAGDACFQGNRIPADRIDPIGSALLNIFPQPNFTDRSVSLGQYNYRDQDVRDVTKRLDQLKVDFNVSTSDRLSVRWRKWFPLTVGYGGTFGAGGNWNYHRQGYTKSEDSIQANYTRIFGPSVVNETSFIARVMRETAPRSEGDTHKLATWGIPSFQLFPAANVDGVLPQLSFGGVPSGATITYDNRYPIQARDERYSIVNTLSWTTGNHLFKMGLIFEHNPASEGPSNNCYQGCLNFSSTTASAINVLNTNHAFANALLGNYTQYQESNLKTWKGDQASLFEWFVQDSWKPVSSLTLDLGVRFAHVSPWRLRDGQEGAAFLLDRWDPAQAPRLFRPAMVGGRRVGFDAASGQVVPESLIGFLVPGSGDFENGMVTDKGPLPPGGLTFMPTRPRRVFTAPRLGFAYDVGGTGRTAIRGSFSVLQDLLPASANFGNNVSGFAPYSRQSTFLYGRIQDLPSAGGFDSPVSPASFDTYDPQTAYTYSLEVQHDLGASTGVSVAYVGNRYLDLRGNRNLNAVPPGARFESANLDPTRSSSPLPDNFLRPLIGYGNINLRTNAGYSRYNSLQVTVNRRARSGLSFGSAYTLAVHRTTDDIPNFHDLDWTYDYAGSDRRHVLSVNAIYDVPAAIWAPPVVRAVLDDWQAAVVAGFQTGTPQEVTFSTTDNFDFTGGGDGGRIVVISGCDPRLDRGERSHDRWFNTSCFARPSGRGDEGSPRRVHFHGPGSQNWDLTMTKSIPLGGPRMLQFRAEFYNLFNQAAWTNVNTSARFNPAGEQITAALGTVMPTGSPRIVQLSLRFAF
jgi:hypothetical protein